MPVQIKPRVKTTQGKQGSAGGGNIGAGLGGLIGGVAGFMQGGAAGAATGAPAGPGGAAAGAAVGGVAGAIKGAGAGAGLGGIAGGLVDPGQGSTAGTQEYISQVPTHQLSQSSQQRLDGIRSLSNMPEARSQYLQPMTEAYIKTQIELKRR